MYRRAALYALYSFLFLPLALNEACVSMYADDSTIYTSATTANEVTQTLNKELQSVLEWVASNKLVLNISKTKHLYFVQIIP